MLKSILIAGVGGQGTLLASKIISVAAQHAGLFVRTSETIGMAQRGGSVSSHVRIGAQNVSPVVPLCHADILLGFELAEAARMVPRLKDNARGVVNLDQIVPTNVALKQGQYLADEYLALLRRKLPHGCFLSATPPALAAGDVRTLNIVMLGAACGAQLLPFEESAIRQAMKECIRPKLLEMNERAFASGIAAACK